MLIVSPLFSDVNVLPFTTRVFLDVGSSGLRVRRKKAFRDVRNNGKKLSSSFFSDSKPFPERKKEGNDDERYEKKRGGSRK